jgi:hypothetical protein
LEALQQVLGFDKKNSQGGRFYRVIKSIYNVMDIWFEILWMILGIIALFIDRSSDQFMVGEDENYWGFGQALPILLIVINFFAALEIYYDNLIIIG